MKSLLFTLALLTSVYSFAGTKYHACSVSCRYLEGDISLEISIISSGKTAYDFNNSMLNCVNEKNGYLTNETDDFINCVKENKE